MEKICIADFAGLDKKGLSLLETITLINCTKDPFGLSGQERVKAP